MSLIEEQPGGSLSQPVIRTESPQQTRLPNPRNPRYNQTMRIQGTPYRTIWPTSDGVTIIDQRGLPFRFETPTLHSVSEMITAIQEMWLRGAPLIGVAGAYGAVLAARKIAREHKIVDLHTQATFHQELEKLATARPTAVNLRWGIEQQRQVVMLGDSWIVAVEKLSSNAARLADLDVGASTAMGDFGLEVIREIQRKKKDPAEPIRILTHCNAGWLATIDRGTATAPIYAARDAGIPIFIWVDETRPRLQGAKLTAFELGEEGIPHAVISDNSGGHLMQQGLVDLCIVGTDRVAANGDVANKIGTYLKALAAFDNHVPFYVAAPSSSIDWNCASGRDIPIEERAPEEVTEISGLDGLDELKTVRICPKLSNALNHGFDVTPARLVSGLITERGIVGASGAGLRKLFPEKFTC